MFLSRLIVLISGEKLLKMLSKFLRPLHLHRTIVRATLAKFIIIYFISTGKLAL